MHEERERELLALEGNLALLGVFRNAGGEEDEAVDFVARCAGEPEGLALLGGRGEASAGREGRGMGRRKRTLSRSLDSPRWLVREASGVMMALGGGPEGEGGGRERREIVLGEVRLFVVRSTADGESGTRDVVECLWVKATGDGDT